MNLKLIKKARLSSLVAALPILAVVACGEAPLIMPESSPAAAIMKDIKAEVPDEIFPGVYQNSAEYNALKHTPWIKTMLPSYQGEPRYFTLLKNDYIAFRFRKDFTDVITEQGYTLEEISQKIFDQLNITPTVQLLSKELIAQFIFSVGETNSHSYAMMGMYSSWIDVHPPLVSIKSKTFLETLAIICAKEYNQVESMAVTPKYLPTMYDNWTYLNTLYKNFVDFLPENMKFVKHRNIYDNKDFPWINNPDSIENFRNWFTGKASLNATILKYLLLNDTNIYHFEGGAEAINIKIAEIISRLTGFFTSKFDDINKDARIDDYLDLEVVFDPISHIYNYNFYDENLQLQSFYFMKALLHTWYDLGNKSGLSLYTSYFDKTKFKISEVRFKSFGSPYTKELKSIQIFNKANNIMLKEIPIMHQKYPLGFNKNPFTDYEYKYIAEGAYVNDDSKWDENVHDIYALVFKIIKNDGSALAESDLTTQLNYFNSDYEESYYLKDAQWTSVKELYK